MTGSQRPMLVDTHAHLADGPLLADVGSVSDRARAAGVGRIVVVGTTAADSRVALDLVGRFSFLHPTVGIHPNHAAEAAEGDWEQVIDLASDPAVVAIGETGLDRHWDFTPFELQQDYFGRHLDLAHRLNLPVVIHCRESADDILAQLETLGRPIKGVLHSFTGDVALAGRFLDLGLHLSFAGMLTFANKTLDPLREAAAMAPLDRILVETDSPYLSPAPFRGKPNEPARVALVAARLAELRGLMIEELAKATTRNAMALFKLPPLA
ncbi:TatD family hydrolase [Isosphaeraceae bacterium EP7]